MADRPAPGAAADSISAELIENRGFTVTRRGFDQGEVKEFLQVVAGAIRALHERIDGLHQELTEAEYRVANPKLDEDTLMRLVGDETGSILRSARATAAEMAANADRRAQEMREAVERECAQLRELVEREVAELRARAEHEIETQRATSLAETNEEKERVERETAELRSRTESETAALRQTTEAETTDLRTRAQAEAARVVDEARQTAGELREQAETAHARATEEAEQVAARIRDTATENAEQIVRRARTEADALRQQAEHDRKLTVEGAQALRERILTDLTRRRRVASTQVEQLRAGRERLLASYGLVRRTLEEINDELHRADEEARQAAAQAGEAYEAKIGDEAVAPDLLQAVPLPASLLLEDEGEAAEIPVDAAGEESPPPPAAPVPDGGQAVTESAEPGAAEPGAAEPGAADTETAAPPEAAPRRRGPKPAGVDDLFARLRAGREVAVSQARTVLEGGAGGETGAAAPAVTAEADPGGTPAANGAAEPAIEAADGPAEAAPVPKRRTDLDLEPARSNEEEGWLQRRDEALGRVEQVLTRRLKRAMQDEQNDLLDRLRSLRARPTPEALLPPLVEQQDRFSRAAAGPVDQGAQSGVAFALSVLAELGQKAVPPGTPAPVEEVDEELAAAIVTPLRHRLQETIAENGDDDQAVLVEALGGAYREWKTQRLERIAGDALASAFARGVLHATPPSVALQWVVDDVDGPCPDCDDNVLAGALPREEAFPTGQFHPPAHAGCRCILVPSV